MTPLALAAALITADPAAVAACESRLLVYEGWTEAPDTRWSLDLGAPGGGRLVYVGAEHSRDPTAPQFAAIETAFAEARPTVVFYEGPDRGLGADARDTIETRGESGYARWLAAQGGARVARLEPSPVDQLQALTARFPADQVMLFFVLREAVRLRDREHLSGAALDEAVARLLGQASGLAQAAGFEAPFSDLAGLEAAYRRHFADGPDWRAAPDYWFQPSADDAETGGRFMGAINAASSAFRNVHMYRVLSRATLDGERVFAVVGRNHVPMQAPALECALGG
jgi:hypothetical protein